MKQRNENACERIRPWLSAYADGELNKKQTAAVRAHVCACSSCAQELEELEQVTVLLRASAEDITPSEQLHASVMRVVSKTPRTMPSPFSRNTVLKRVGSVLACAGCLVVIGVAVISGGIKDESFDAMSPDADAPMAEAPNGNSEDFASEDKTADEPDAPMEPEDSPPPESPGDVAGETYVLTRAVDVGSDELDGEWMGDGLTLSFAPQTEQIKMCFDGEETRVGVYKLSDTELTVRLEDGERLYFEWSIEGGTLWLIRK